MTAEQILQSRNEDLAAFALILNAAPIPGKAAIQQRIDALKARWAGEDAAAATTQAAADREAANYAAAHPPNTVNTNPLPPDVVLVEGQIITEGGKTYEVRAWPFGLLKVLIKAPPVAAPAPTVTVERADFAAYLKGRLMLTDELLAQAELIAALTWLSKRS